MINVSTESRGFVENRRDSLHGLIMHLGRLHMCRDRASEVTKLTDVCSRVNINSLGEVVVRRVRRSKVWRQAPVHLGVDELSALGKQEFANVVEREPGLLHRVGDGHRLEVATVVNLTGLAIDEGIVGCCT